MILKIAWNYLILLIYGLVLGFRGGWIYFILPVILISLSWFDYRCSSKWRMVLILHIHLLISTILGTFFGGYLYCNYVYDDAETRMLIILMLMVGSSLVIGLGVIAVWLKYFFAKKREKAS